jgi:hypothetical protein
LAVALADVSLRKLGAVVIEEALRRASEANTGIGGIIQQITRAALDPRGEYGLVPWRRFANSLPRVAIPLRLLVDCCDTAQREMGVTRATREARVFQKGTYGNLR